MILAIDQGTTGTTCLVFDDEGQVRGRAYSEFEAALPAPRWVEHDATEIWEGPVRSPPRRSTGRDRRRRADRGRITNQRETVVAWDPASG